MNDCGTCDLQRGILCIDCYQSCNDDCLPPTYADYVAWAAWYPTRRERRRLTSLVLAAGVTCLCLVGAAPATNTDERLGGEIAALRAKTAEVNEAFERLEAARHCSESGFLTDLAEAFQQSRQGGPESACAALTRG
jgi:hypothetical protein